MQSAGMSDHTDREIDRAIDLAMKKLRYSSLKDKQREAITHFLKGYDCFVSLPTGYGKSLCYALLPYAFDALRGREGSVVLCVSPLISLMVDQRDKFSDLGLSAEYVAEIREPSVMAEVMHGGYQLLYVSPESLIRNPLWREILSSALYKDSLVAFVVDEAHCVKHWSVSFLAS